MFTNNCVLFLLTVANVALTVSSARFDLFSSLEWCTKFPDDEAREQCQGTSGTLWLFSSSCCNVKFECVDGEYYQGLRCKESGHVPDRDSMRCVADDGCTASQITTTTEVITTTLRTTTTTVAAPWTTTTDIPPSSQFCLDFPTTEPPIYCAGIEGPQWLSSTTCCNVKFECLNGAYSQGFRCGTPGYIPDIQQFKCIEEPRCISESHPGEEIGHEPPEIICCNGSDEYLPHPTACSKYLQCNAGKLSIFECDAGTIFHYESQRCLLGSQDTCDLSIVYV
uniref:Putative conserved secreted protein n=1 Tax=Culex tarsalis TaxID=7177 RepID=A0A1Q3FLL0_CULTA